MISGDGAVRITTGVWKQCIGPRRRVVAAVACAALTCGVLVLPLAGAPVAAGAAGNPSAPAGAAAAAGMPVQVVNAAAGGQAAWAARQLRRALAAAGYAVSAAGPVVRLEIVPGAAQSFRIVPGGGAAADNGVGAVASKDHGAAVSGVHGVSIPSGHGVSIPSGHGASMPSGHGVTVVGGDGRGLVYGALRLCAELRAGRRLGQIPAESRAPQLAIRAFKYNLPLPGTVYLAYRNLQHHAWFWRHGYWRQFLDTLARDRFSALEFWSADPWPQLVSLRKFPEADRLSPARMRRQEAFFHWLFHAAWERGLDVYLVTWNVDLPPGFARANHLPERNVNTPLVRRYLRAAIRAVLREYPHLTGLGTTQGEQMRPIPPDRRAAWIADVYFRAIDQSGRKHVPFILRYWGGTPGATARAAAGYHDGPVYLDIKYNGEHAISSARPHLQNHAWLSQAHNYKILWHLRNDDIFTLRWGDPGLVRRMMADLKATGAAGFSFGSEADVPGRDNYDTPRFQQRQAEPYEFQKQWLMYALFGRLGFNDSASNRIWLRGFERRYGPAGDALAAASETASRIAPQVTRFHWNYMNGDWMVEGDIGSWNTSAEQPRINYRRDGLYHGLRAWIFNNTLDRRTGAGPGAATPPVSREWEENIPRYAAARAAGAPQMGETPLAVAAQLEAEGRQVLAAGRIATPPAPYRAAFLAARSDDLAWANLGRYYAAKIWAATAAGEYLFTGDVSEKRRAIGELQIALRDWRRLAAITSRHYLPREVWQFGRFSWGKYTPEVEGDIATARSLRPFPAVTQTWRVKPAGGGKAGGGKAGGGWTRLTLHLRGPLAANGLAAWLVDYDAWTNAAAVQAAARGRARVIWVGRAARPGAVLLVSGDRVVIARQAGRRLRAVRGMDRGVQAFRLPRAGAFTVETAANQAPVLLSALPAQTITAKLQAVVAPVARSRRGAVLTAAVQMPPWDENIWRQAWNAGLATYRFRLSAAGLYRVVVLASGGGLSLTVDRWNGPDKGLRREGARWVSGSPFVLGAGQHTVQIFFDHPGVTVRRVEVRPWR
jgi:hypothetical protein